MQGLKATAEDAIYFHTGCKAQAECLVKGYSEFN